MKINWKQIKTNTLWLLLYVYIEKIEEINKKNKKIFSLDHVQSN